MEYIYSPPLPLMELDAQQPEFDYTAFLQEEEADYLAEDSSASASTNTLALTPPQGQSPTDVGPSSGAASRARQAKQRLERRGHTKSRRGCYNCKRRRIKVLLSVLERISEMTGWNAHVTSSVKRRGRPAVTVSRRDLTASTRRRHRLFIRYFPRTVHSCKVRRTNRHVYSHSTRSRSSACRICVSSSTS
jgi:hypothetical protein